MSRTAFAIVILASLTISSPAFALSICGTLRYWDDRNERSSGSGSKLAPSTENTNRPARRVLLSLYEQKGNCNDFDASCNDLDDDDFTASVYSNATDGSFCFNNLPSGRDWYYLTRYESDDTDVQVNSGPSGGHILGVSRTKFNVTSTVTKNWNITCVDDTENNTEGYCDGNTEANGLFGAWIPYANILDSMVDVDWLISPDTLFHLNSHNGRIVAFYPDSPAGDCGSSYLGKALPDSCDDLCIGAGFWVDNHTVAHEVGHVLMKRALNHCTGTLTDATCGSYGWDSSGSEKCATAEGWANFVAGATYWEDSSTGPPVYWPFTASPSQQLENLTTRGNSSSWEDCVSIGSSPETAPGNVARFFWDVYDSTTSNEGGTDNSHKSFGAMLSVWDDFSAGTGNWQNNESGSNGVNVYDYYHYDTSVGDEIVNNCLDNQDPL